MLQQLHFVQFSDQIEVHRLWPWKNAPLPLSLSILSTHLPLHSTVDPNKEGSQQVIMGYTIVKTSFTKHSLHHCSLSPLDLQPVIF